jgi:hypothetical protein
MQKHCESEKLNNLKQLIDIDTGTFDLQGFYHSLT